MFHGLDWEGRKFLMAKDRAFSAMRNSLGQVIIEGLTAASRDSVRTCILWMFGSAHSPELKKMPPEEKAEENDMVPKTCAIRDDF